MSLTPEDERQFIQRLETLGVTEVRLKLPIGGWAPALEPIVTKWLADKEREAERSREASQAEQIEIARSASNAAERAAAAAERASAAAERQAAASQRQAEAADRQAEAADRANTRATIALAIAIISIIATVSGMAVVHLDAIRHVAH
jgi:hypothetical protein